MTRQIDIDAEQTNVVPLDRDAIDLIARQRRATGSRDAYWGENMAVDRTGVAGEAAVALRYDLPSPGRATPGGDGGIDFEVRHNGLRERWDVKATRHADPSLMVPESYAGPADAYVLVTIAEADDGALFGILVGYARAERVIRETNRRASKGGGEHFELGNDALGPVPDADVVHAVETADARTADEVTP